MMNEQKNINEQLLRDWAEMKKLQRPEYWAKMNRKVQEVVRRRRRIRFITYAALFILPVLGCCLYFLHVDSNRVSKNSIPALTSISPGEKKAILYTSDGTPVVLTQDTLDITESNGTRILPKITMELLMFPKWGIVWRKSIIHWWFPSGENTMLRFLTGPGFG